MDRLSKLIAPLLALVALAALAMVASGCGTTDADPERGRELFKAKCGTCHTFAAAESGGVTGPDLDEVLPGETRAHVEEMIKDPNAEIAKGYPPNVMPQNYEQELTPKELEDLVKFLLENAGASSKG